MQEKLQIPVENYGTLYGNEKYLTRAEVAAMIRKSEKTVKNYVKAGKLPKPTDSGLFNEVEVIEYRTRRS